MQWACTGNWKLSGEGRQRHSIAFRWEYWPLFLFLNKNLLSENVVISLFFSICLRSCLTNVLILWMFFDGVYSQVSSPTSSTASSLLITQTSFELFMLSAESYICIASNSA